MAKKKLWVLKPTNEKAQQWCRDFFYQFGKEVYHGSRMAGWNGNNFVVTSTYEDEEWLFISPEGEEYTMKEFTKLMSSVEGQHAPDEYWNPWIRGCERDVPLMKMTFERSTIEFWMIRPETIHGDKSKKQRTYKLRVSSHSAKKIASKFEKFYKEELKQYYAVPLDKSLIKKDKSDAYVNAQKMWKFGNDLYILQYQGTSSNNHLFRGTMYCTVFPDGRTGWIVSSDKSWKSGLESQIQTASVSFRNGDCRGEIKAFKKEVAINEAVDGIISQVKHLNENFGTDERTEKILNYLEEIKT